MHSFVWLTIKPLYPQAKGFNGDSNIPNSVSSTNQNNVCFWAHGAKTIHKSFCLFGKLTLTD